MDYTSIYLYVVLNGTRVKPLHVAARVPTTSRPNLHGPKGQKYPSPGYVGNCNYGLREMPPVSHSQASVYKAEYSSSSVVIQ